LQKQQLSGASPVSWTVSSSLPAAAGAVRLVSTASAALLASVPGSCFTEAERGNSFLLEKCINQVGNPFKIYPVKK